MTDLRNFSKYKNAENKAMINTYNESSLHETLKNLVAQESNAKTECQIDGAKWIFDVVDNFENVAEIQTGNIGALNEKLKFLILNQKNVRVVRPVIVEKTIKTIDENGILKNCRKSPKIETIYSILRGLGKITDILLKIQIDVLFISATETRLFSENPVQLKNRSRRHLKKYVPIEKSLGDVFDSRTLKTKDDWLSLVPKIAQPFTTAQLSKSIFDFVKIDGIKMNESSKKRAANQARLLLWLLEKMNLCKRVGKIKNAILWQTVREN